MSGLEQTANGRERTRIGFPTATGDERNQLLTQRATCAGTLVFARAAAFLLPVPLISGSKPIKPALPRTLFDGFRRARIPLRHRVRRFFRSSAAKSLVLPASTGEKDKPWSSLSAADMADTRERPTEHHGTAMLREEASRSPSCPRERNFVPGRPCRESTKPGCNC